MSEAVATAPAAPSPAPPVTEIDRGPMVNWTREERSEFKRTLEIPEQHQPKPEEPAPSDAAKESKADTQAEPAAAKQQENHTDKGSRGKPGAEERIGELVSETKRLKAELEALKAPKPEPQAKPVERQAPVTSAKPTVEDKNQDGSPKYKTYEEYVEALSDWKFGERWAANQRQEQQKAVQKEIAAKVEDARTRYGKEKFDAVIFPANSAIVSDQGVSPAVKAMLNDSEVLPDLLYALGSDPKELASFMDMAKTNPGKALRYIALTESLIHEELEGKKEPSAPPAKTQTAAPKPPAVVGGRNTAPPDALESAATAGDFRRFKAEFTRRQIARLQG